jgi:hypothetical protein
VAHFLEFIDNGVGASGADEEDAIGQAADDFLQELLAGEQFRGEDRVLGLDETDAAVKFHRNARA